MARRTGSADLPLHGGRVPAWLGQRMASLGVIVCQAIVHHYGRDEFLQRLSHPFCFQSFGAVMGMDWHSSGITTSVIGALKRGLAPLQDELGIHACAGRGQHSRKTPDELGVLAQKLGFDGEALIRAASAGACRWPTLCAGSPGFPRKRNMATRMSDQVGLPRRTKSLPENCGLINPPPAQLSPGSDRQSDPRMQATPEDR